MLQRAELLGEPVAVCHLNQPRYWLPEVSHVFHGRDIFSPVAAHLANGVALSTLGEIASDPVRLELPQPSHDGNRWRGQVIHIDHFGNIATNLRREHLAGENQQELVVYLCGQELHGLVRTFGERSPGELVALYGSTGNLIVSEVYGNAASRLQARRGDSVEVLLPG
jgi:hypothetical protein